MKEKLPEVWPEGCPPAQGILADTLGKVWSN